MYLVDVRKSEEMYKVMFSILDVAQRGFSPAAPHACIIAGHMCTTYILQAIKLHSEALECSTRLKDDEVTRLGLGTSIRLTLTRRCEHNLTELALCALTKLTPAQAQLVI